MNKRRKFILNNFNNFLKLLNIKKIEKNFLTEREALFIPNNRCFVQIFIASQRINQRVITINKIRSNVWQILIQPK
jgi:hypothetical protein